MPKLKRLSHSALKDVVLSDRQHVIVSKREQNGLSVWAKTLGKGIATIKVREGQYDVVRRFQSDCHGESIWWNANTKSYHCFKCFKSCEAV